MIHFADDNAHCDRADCPKSLSCMRYLAWEEKRKQPKINARLVMFSPNPADCKNYLEVSDALP